MVAHQAYDRSDKHWILMHINNVIDPYHDWVIDYNTLEEYVLKRYPNRAAEISSTNSSVGVSEVAPLQGEKIWSVMVFTTNSGTFQDGERIVEDETGNSCKAFDFDFSAVGTKTGIIPLDFTGENYFIKGNTFTGQSSGAIGTITEHISATVLGYDMSTAEIIYKIDSPSNNASVGTKFTQGEMIITNRNTTLKIESDMEERSATAYYEITKTNADGTIERIQTNKTLTQDEKDALPSGFSDTPTAISFWDHIFRENNKNREINLLELEYVDPFESEFISKMSK